MHVSSLFIQNAVELNPNLPRPVAVLAFALRKVRTQGCRVVETWRAYAATRDTSISAIRRASEHGVELPELCVSIDTYAKLERHRQERRRHLPVELRGIISYLERCDELRFSVRSWRRVLGMAITMLPTVAKWTDDMRSPQLERWTSEVRGELQAFNWLIDEMSCGDRPEQLDVNRFSAAIEKVNVRLCELEQIHEPPEEMPVIAGEIVPMQMAEIPGKLAKAITQFALTAKATTTLGQSGRRVTDIAAAVVLSKAAQELTNVSITASQMLMDAHAVAIDPSTLGVKCHHSDRHDGGWEEIPSSVVHAMTQKIGDGGIDPLLQMAIYAAFQVVGIPRPIWNAWQAAKPGGPHQRFRVGDELGLDVTERLEAVAGLLPIHEPASATGATSPQSAHPSSIGTSTSTESGALDKDSYMSIPHIVKVVSEGSGGKLVIRPEDIRRAIEEGRLRAWRKSQKSGSPFRISVPSFLGEPEFTPFHALVEAESKRCRSVKLRHIPARQVAADKARTGRSKS